MAQKSPVILFLDNDDGSSRHLRVSFRRQGAIALAAHSVAELFQIADRFPPDLIVADGDHDQLGPDVLAALLHRQIPHATILLAASSVSPTVRAHLDQHPTVHLVEKPTPPDVLATRIRSFLKGRLSRGAPAVTRKPLVACIDDDLMYVDSLERLLTHNGCRVVTFTDPERALDAIPTLGVDLVILDVRMPGMNGLNLAEELRDSFKGRLPIVMLTGLGTDRDIAEGYRKGVSYYITKPCAPRTILNIVDYLVGDLDESERELLEAEL